MIIEMRLQFRVWGVRLEIKKCVTWSLLLCFTMWGKSLKLLLSFKSDYRSLRSVTECAVDRSIRSSLLPHVLCAVILFCAEKKKKTWGVWSNSGDFILYL